MLHVVLLVSVDIMIMYPILQLNKYLQVSELDSFKNNTDRCWALKHWWVSEWKWELFQARALIQFYYWSLIFSGTHQRSPQSWSSVMICSVFSLSTREIESVSDPRSMVVWVDCVFFYKEQQAYQLQRFGSRFEVALKQRLSRWNRFCFTICLWDINLS